MIFFFSSLKSNKKPKKLNDSIKIQKARLLRCSANNKLKFFFSVSFTVGKKQQNFSILWSWCFFLKIHGQIQHYFITLRNTYTILDKCMCKNCLAKVFVQRLNNQELFFRIFLGTLITSNGTPSVDASSLKSFFALEDETILQNKNKSLKSPFLKNV